MRSFSQHGWQKEHLSDCCRSVTAPRLRLLKWLTYLDCWIWLAKHIVILCCSRKKIKGILSGICQSTTRGFPGETIRPKNSSHKVLTQNHDLRGVLIKKFFNFLYGTCNAFPDILFANPLFLRYLPVGKSFKKIKMQPFSLYFSE